MVFWKQVRGSKLQDMLEVSVLKPCVLDLVEGMYMVEITIFVQDQSLIWQAAICFQEHVILTPWFLSTEDYTEDLAIAHVRRLLDIVACTTSFGSSGKQAEPKSSQEPIKTLGQGAAASNPAAHMAEGNGNMPPAGEDFEGRQEVSAQAIESVPRAEIDKTVIVKSEKRVFKGKPEAAAAIAAAKEATEKGDMTGMCPPSKLGQFYEFLSFSHLTPPLQCKYSLLSESL
jgi:protein TIF31